MLFRTAQHTAFACSLAMCSMVTGTAIGQDDDESERNTTIDEMILYGVDGATHE